MNIYFASIKIYMNDTPISNTRNRIHFESNKFA